MGFRTPELSPDEIQHRNHMEYAEDDDQEDIIPLKTAPVTIPSVPKPQSSGDKVRFLSSELLWLNF